jgi:hypothetical protein
MSDVERITRIEKDNGERVTRNHVTRFTPPVLLQTTTH